jgi:hypothetical protein
LHASVFIELFTASWIERQRTARLSRSNTADVSMCITGPTVLQALSCCASASIIIVVAGAICFGRYEMQVALSDVFAAGVWEGGGAVLLFYIQHLRTFWQQHEVAFCCITTNDVAV